MDLDSTLAEPGVLGHGPLLCLVEEHLGIGDVISQVHIGLGREDTVGIADVCLELHRHLVKVQEQAREGAAVHLQQRVVGVHDIDGYLTAEGVDHCLDAIADVVEAFSRDGRVWVAAGGGECVLQPPHLAGAIHHRIWVIVHGQERRQRFDPLADLTSVLDPCIRRYLVAKQYVDIGELPGVSQPPESRAQIHASGAVVVQITPRRVDLRGGAVHDGEGRRRLAIVQLGPLDRNLPPDWNVLDEEFGASFIRSEPGCRAHGYAVAVGVLKPAVHPVAGVSWQVVWVQLPRRQQHLPQMPVQDVAV